MGEDAACEWRHFVAWRVGQDSEWDAFAVTRPGKGEPRNWVGGTGADGGPPSPSTKVLALGADSNCCRHGFSRATVKGDDTASAVHVRAGCSRLPAAACR